MINITKAAQDYFTKLLKKQKPETYIRIFVINPGTISAKCGLSYCNLNDIKLTDIKFKYDLITVYIDKVSISFLRNSEIDIISNQLETKLTITAPNTKIKKINNNNPLINKVKYIIESQINPQLAIHGGYISLIEITTDKYVIIKFNGGCNGCSMVNVTLKKGIEKKLLNIFPKDIKGVKDITEHQHNDYSYY